MLACWGRRSKLLVEYADRYLVPSDSVIYPAGFEMECGKSKEISSMSLLDFVVLFNASYKLSNTIKLASERGELPFVTVDELLSAGEMGFVKLLKIRGYGKTCDSELRQIVSNSNVQVDCGDAEHGDGEKESKEKEDKTDYLLENDIELTDAVIGLSQRIVNFFKENKEENTVDFKTINDTLILGQKKTEQALLDQPSLGKKTVKEFIDRIRILVKYADNPSLYERNFDLSFLKAKYAVAFRPIINNYDNDPEVVIDLLTILKWESILEDFEKNPQVPYMLNEFWWGKTLESIGSDQGITRERVRQIINPYLDCGILTKKDDEWAVSCLQSIIEFYGTVDKLPSKQQIDDYHKEIYPLLSKMADSFIPSDDRDKIIHNAGERARIALMLGLNVEVEGAFTEKIVVEKLRALAEELGDSTLMPMQTQIKDSGKHDANALGTCIKKLGGHQKVAELCGLKYQGKRMSPDGSRQYWTDARVREYLHRVAEEEGHPGSMPSQTIVGKRTLEEFGCNHVPTFTRAVYVDYETLSWLEVAQLHGLQDKKGTRKMGNPVFKKVDYTLGNLLSYLEMGDIGLPDLQREFVWSNKKVCELFDSMYRGYPVGSLLFWQNATDERNRTIGADQKQRVPKLLVVDGQQRLTSIYAVMKGIPVVRANHEKNRLIVSFNPLSDEFRISNTLDNKNKKYLPDISVMWNDDTDIFEVVDNYCQEIESVRALSPEETKKVRDSFRHLQAMTSFPFTALEMSSDISDDEVGDIFVRINSSGKTLNQSDFILTLMSVNCEEGRKRLEAFSRECVTPSSAAYNEVFRPSPERLLRINIGFAFKKARLKAIYSLLHGQSEYGTKKKQGQDAADGEKDVEKVDLFDVLLKAQDEILNPQHWNDFIGCIRSSGFRTARLIKNDSALIFAYVLYLIGKVELGVELSKLKRGVCQWFFMSVLTSRYASSSDSKTEYDLNRFDGISKDDFLPIIQKECDSVLTEDYWALSLPNQAASGTYQSPFVHAYHASLIALGATALYSNQSIVDLLDKSKPGVRGPFEKHHLFPKAYLASQGVAKKRVDQIANYAVVGWDDNAKISKSAPTKYVPGYEAEFDKQQLATMYEMHGLEAGWHEMKYEVFLGRRREALSNVIKKAYEQVICGQSSISYDRGKLPEDSITDGESETVEFKSTIRVNLHTDEIDPRIQMSALKTIAGFLNSKGGRLFVGVADDGSPVGIDKDKFQNEDKMSLFLVDLVRSRLGVNAQTYISHNFEDYRYEDEDENEVIERVLIIDVEPSPVPVFTKDGNSDRFFVRSGPSTADFSMSEATEYITHRFKSR